MEFLSRENMKYRGLVSTEHFSRVSTEHLSKVSTEHRCISVQRPDDELDYEVPKIGDHGVSR